MAFWGRREKTLREPLDFRDLPRRPSSRPVAFLLCHYVSFRDALEAWGEQDPEISDVLPSDPRFGPAKAEKKRCAEAIAEALGPHDNFGAARKAIEEWCTEARARAEFVTRTDRLRAKDVPIMVPVWEINTTVRWLLEAYENPLRFFRETAPCLYPQDFTFWSDPDSGRHAVWEGNPDDEPPKHDPPVQEDDSEPPRRILDRARVASTAREWGRFAHLNPSFQEAWLASGREAPSFFASVVGPAENLESFRRTGRPPGPEREDSHRRKNKESGELSLLAAKMLTEGVSETDHEEARRSLQSYPDLLAAVEAKGSRGNPHEVADNLVARFGPFAGLARSTVKKWRLVATKK